MKKYILPTICSFLLPFTSQAQKNERDIPPPTAEYYMNRYQFDEATKLLNQDIRKLKRKGQSAESEEESLLKINRMRVMIRATERLVFIDSVVVDKASFPTRIRLGAESGKIIPYCTFFNRTDSNDCTVFVSALGNKLFYARPDEKKGRRLFTSDLVGDKWTTPRELEELDEDDAQNCPFMLSDGVTLYYAARGEESIGGYDIFVTRYDMDKKKFLQPENVGMPFNSPANDYLLAIDEFNQLGWLVSDRNQPEGKVCIYVFIPNDARKTYDADVYEADMLHNMALIGCIADTWDDKETVEEAQRRLQAISDTSTGRDREKHFEFIVDDRHTYTSPDEFKSIETHDRAAAWHKRLEQLVKDKRNLQSLRDRYASANESQRQTLKGEILRLEAQCEKTETALRAEAKSIRNTEIRFCEKK